MNSISVQEAQLHLLEIIEKLSPGEEIVLVNVSKPLARLVKEPREKPAPVLGRCEGMLTIVSEDDEHLNDWAGYMP